MNAPIATETRCRRSLDPVVGHHGETETDMKIELYCTCGSAWKGFLTKQATEATVKLWNSTHAGEGHAPTAAKAAARARSKAERESYAETRREGRGE